jgi:hypothetical protein
MGVRDATDAPDHDGEARTEQLHNLRVDLASGRRTNGKFSARALPGHAWSAMQCKVFWKRVCHSLWHGVKPVCDQM